MRHIAMLVPFVLIQLGLVLGCRDAATGPEPGGKRTVAAAMNLDFNHWCRLWPNGQVLHSDGKGGWDTNGCHVSVTATPSLYMGSANPVGVTYDFSVPVTDLDASSDEPRGGRCPPATPMTYKLLRSDESVIAQGNFDFACSGAVYAYNNFAVAGGFVSRCIFTAPVPLAVDFDTATGRAVEMTLQFNMPCIPTGDSMLDTPAVKQALLDALNASLPNTPSINKQRREHGGVVVHAADGHYYAVAISDPQASSCAYSYIRGMGPGTISVGDTLVASYHSHPYKTGEWVYDDCPEQVPSGKRKPADPLDNGGAEDGDWDAATFPEFVINNEGEVVRLDAAVKRGKPRRTNPNRWQFTNDGVLCLQQSQFVAGK